MAFSRAISARSGQDTPEESRLSGHDPDHSLIVRDFYFATEFECLAQVMLYDVVDQPKKH
jgi:hypothetical protein